MSHNTKLILILIFLFYPKILFAESNTESYEDCVKNSDLSTFSMLNCIDNQISTINKEISNSITQILDSTDKSTLNNEHELNIKNIQRQCSIYVHNGKFGQRGQVAYKQCMLDQTQVFKNYINGYIQFIELE